MQREQEVCEPTAGYLIRIPDALYLRGSLSGDVSQFGDEFLNSPAYFGKRPPAGRTVLNGWIEVRFEPPQNDTSMFVLSYEALGTDETLVWGGGQKFKITRNRLTPLTELPGGMRGINSGKLNLKTGVVDTCSVRLCAAFQNSLIGEVGALNRIPFAFPFVFPAPSFPMEIPGIDAEHAERPRPEYGEINFGIDVSGRIISIEIRAETNVPVSIFPLLGLFPPFSFGATGRFYFGRPNDHLLDTPPENCPTIKTHPDGIHLPPPACFHPHLALKSTDLKSYVPFTHLPSVTPRVSDAFVALYDSRVFVIGGLDEGGASGKVFVCRIGENDWIEGVPTPYVVSRAGAACAGSCVYVVGGRDFSGVPTRYLQIYDMRKDEWHAGPDLLFPVASPAVAAIGDRLIVAGGWGEATGESVVSSRVQLFDLQAEEWCEGNPMLLPVAEAGTICVGSEMYVVNGIVASGKNTNRVSTFSAATRLWGALPSTTDAVRQPAVACVGDVLLRIGGTDDKGSPVRSVMRVGEPALSVHCRSQALQGSLRTIGPCGS